MEPLRELLAGVETDEDPDFDNEENEPEDALEEISSDRESFCEHESTEWRKTKFWHNIRCHNIVSRLPGTKEPVKDVTSPVKSFACDNSSTITCYI
ncbi:hypothetical protein AVEN_113880-1 [Araneus ventricosus]|uniref:Uncharacterized protein n=1 Tax=Araneus ventricosus TaxID=182803 RepID=A0A4Y2DB95_ARAVE|nr:hypothetical protein AVEN_113880-1 [Araneus ventricosus]